MVYTTYKNCDLGDLFTNIMANGKDIGYKIHGIMITNDFGHVHQTINNQPREIQGGFNT